MLKCPFCNFENEDGALFCEQCKTDLGTDPVAAAEPIHAPPLAAETAQAETIPLGPGEITAPVAAVVVEEVHYSDTVPMAEVASEAETTAHALSSTAAPSAQATPVASLAEPPDAEPVHEPTVAVAPQPEPTAAGAGEGKLAEGARPKLVVLRGQRMNVEYPIYEGDNYVGRADDKPVDVDLEDQEPEDRIWSSRQHALITFEGGQLAIEDLNSTNGTFVNRTRVDPGKKRPLQVNDVIQIGTVQMKVKL
jgi:hypothetical protein